MSCYCKSSKFGHYNSFFISQCNIAWGRRYMQIHSIFVLLIFPLKLENSTKFLSLLQVFESSKHSWSASVSLRTSRWRIPYGHPLRKNPPCTPSGLQWPRDGALRPDYKDSTQSRSLGHEVQTFGFTTKFQNLVSLQSVEPV